MPTIAEQLDRARKDELLDLTLRNPLISYKRRKSYGIQLQDARAATVHQRLAAQERSLRFAPLEGEAESPDGSTADLSGAEKAPADHAALPEGTVRAAHPADELETRLLKTYHRARRSLEEEGVVTLHVALGMLRWYEDQHSEIERRAPLILIPVELTRTDVRGTFRLRATGDEPAGNLSLGAYLKSTFGLKWPLPPDPDEQPLDPEGYYDELEDIAAFRERWSIDRGAAVVDFFSFTRFLMYEDLDVENWPEERRPDEHPVLERLLHRGFEAPEGRIGEDEHLDDHLPPDETYHVVDSDSSQTRALLDVAQGLNLVLQGPPGTGKSQTITNILADAIAQQKTVLFVSEKMAALDVVKRNMDSVGLGDACLELHSHKSRKADVLKELERTLRLGRPRVEDFSKDAAVYGDARARLNRYAEAVNAPLGDSGIRPYQAYGQLLQLRETLETIEPVPQLDLPEMTEWSAAAYEQHAFLVQQVESHLVGMGVPIEHPFYGSRRDRYLPAQRAHIEEIAAEAGDALDAYRRAGEELAAKLGLEALGDINAAEVLVSAAETLMQAPDLRGIDVQAEAWTVHAARIEELMRDGERHRELHERFGDLLIPDAWEQDVMPLRKALVTYGSAWYRWFVGEWREAKRELAALCLNELPADPDERLEIVDAILEGRRLAEAIEEDDELGRTLFGARWRGPSSDWPALRSAAAFLMELHRRVGAGELPDRLLETLADPPDDRAVKSRLDDLTPLQEAYLAAIERLTQELELDEAERFEGSTLRGQPFEVQEEFARRCAEEAPRLQEIVTYNHLVRDLHGAGLQPVCEVVDRWPHASRHLVDAFRHNYLNALLEHAMDERPALKNFSGGSHERVVQRFRELDREVLDHSRHELALKHWKRKPRRSGAGQVGVLLHECGKKTRHMPLRRLMQRAGQAIQGLKPVFMMSPMSVPKYLPPESIGFDLVVFDEASQVRPVDAFGSILRGGQTVVVGDSKQLPPTSFFDTLRGADRDDYEMHAGDQESILDLFQSKGAPERMLRFHYRSRHESLIAVSNREFYDHNLFVFPSPDASRTNTGLVYHHHPDTVYERGGSSTNPDEARIVAEHVMQHARNEPHMSLGVATFSTAQMEAIQAELEAMRREDPSCEDFFGGHPEEPFFVKNLETVQGDQRDVMYISIGYGRDATGRVAMNFGPLNRDGGERRLNVLITRAKYRCEIFTNMRAEDIDLHRTQARGVQVLKTYLHFAATDELDIALPTGGAADSPFEEAVARALRQKGYRVKHQIGSAGFFIDLAVVDPERPGRYLLGIECDGASYHSSRMARVRDRSRQAILEGLGWTIHRIWSTDWFRNPQDQLARTVAAIERAGVHGDGKPTNGEAPPSTRKEIDTAAEKPTARPGVAIERQPVEESTDGLQHVRPYEKARPQIGTRQPLHEVPTPTVASWVRSIVKAESPVHIDVVTRRIMDAMGISRMGRRIQRKVQAAAAHAEGSGWVEKHGKFLRKPGQTDIPVRSRAEVDGPARDIEHVPPDEIAAAVRQVVEASFGVRRDELIAEVGRHLGYARIGANIRDSISSVVDRMLKLGRLTETEEELALAR